MELLNKTDHVMKRNLKILNNKSNSEIRQSDFTEILKYLMRGMHIGKSIGDDLYFKQFDTMLNQLIEIIQSRELKPVLLRIHNELIKRYSVWVDKLYRVEKEDPFDEYDVLLLIRDSVQGTLELLEIIGEKNINAKMEIDKIDERFRTIGPTFRKKFLDNDEKLLFPEKIYWWWYFGGTETE